MKEKMRYLPLPRHVEAICKTLTDAGFRAYAVGGCVRDLLLSRTPHDYDVATSARPEEVKRLFPHTYDTGLLHGTVTVVTDEGAIEVTTFRKDGAYTDKRRPDSVDFLSEIDEDLKRRDFTVNAIAYSPESGVYDPFSGEADLEKKLLRTVGDPRQRFGEDALRILRLFRFAAQLSFSVEEETEKAAREMAATLQDISRERIFAELTKLLTYANFSALSAAEVVFRVTVPKASLSASTFQKVAACRTLSAKWAHLLDEDAAETLRSLHAPRALVLSAEELSAYKRGESIVFDVASLKHSSAEELFDFLQDAAAEKEWICAKENGTLMHMAELPISGRDLAEIGFSGREIGEALGKLFMYAIKNPANTKKEILWEEALWIYKNEHLKTE